MASCLGIYINNNVIKYAKVNKQKDKLKVETFGIKFYTDLKQAINQIISETVSSKIPVSINLSNEDYNYFSMSNLLSKKDLKKAVDTEFESMCYEKKTNSNALESRYALVNFANNKDKIKVIHVSTDKMKVNKVLQDFQNSEIANISPLPLSIANIAPINKNENMVIVNMEDNTTVTTITGDKVYDVQIIDTGAKDVLNNINKKENSFAKAYEFCKNTTIYTMEAREEYDGENQYLSIIIPVLYEISNKVKEIISKQPFKINKIYLTGNLSVVNNIDLYFEEIIKGTRCEILKPFFIDDSPKSNIKDYIEVNSALSLALAGLGEGIQGMNFKTLSFSEKIPDWLKVDVNPEKTKKEKKYLGGFFTNDLGQKLDKTEKSLIRTAVGLGILLVVYSGFSILLNNQMQQKYQEAE